MTGVLYQYRQVTPTIEAPYATDLYQINLVTACCTASVYLKVALYDPNTPSAIRDRRRARGSIDGDPALATSRGHFAYGASKRTAAAGSVNAWISNR